MRRFRQSARLALGLLFVLVVANSAKGQVASNRHAASVTAIDSTSDYIYLDGFEPAPDCSAALSCALPSLGKSCISGRLTEAGSGGPLRALFRADLACGAGAVGGPCDLALTTYDAVQFVSNPAGSSALVSVESTVDGCGRFRFADIDPPGSGTVAIVAHDGGDLYAPTATLHSLGTTVRIDDINAVVTRNDTVTQWTQSAGSPFGASSFADVGVILLDFNAGGFPQDGVKVTQSGSSTPGQDYYFSDASLLERLHVDSMQDSTGINGSALFVNGAFTSYSGTGGEPMGCIWPSELAATIEGVVVFLDIGC